MTGRDEGPSPGPYSPRRRTALVLTGTGTAGAYHAGVLRALHEAGIKIDIVAGRGIGAVGALFAAIDGGQRLWDEKGFWRTQAVARLYPWRGVLRLVVGAVALAAALVLLPLGAAVIGLVVFPLDFLLKMVGAEGSGGVVEWYLRTTNEAFAPEGLPTWLPRLVLLVLGVATAVAAAAAWSGRSERQARGRAWWRVVRAPLSSAPAVALCWSAMWDLLRGAASLKQPPVEELGRRYTDVLIDNLGQPGFRELVIVVHDLDADRDLVFALVHESRRRTLVHRSTTREADERKADVLDLAGLGRGHLADALAASLAVPLATEPHEIHFAAEAHWRGERHRLCDRPSSLARVFEELAYLGAEQVVLVSASPEAPGPHALARQRLDGRGRIGEVLQSFEGAELRDNAVLAGPSASLFIIRPAHNPVGPFDFAGGFDDRSDRPQPIAELMAHGYEDAYRQFIEPVVGAPDGPDGFDGLEGAAG